MDYTFKTYTRGKTEQDRIKLLKELANRWSLRPELPIEWLKSTDFFIAPASKVYHGAYEGGLFDHCMNVAQVLMKFTNRGVSEKWSRRDSPLIVGILHDATKFGKYFKDEEDGYQYNPLYTFPIEPYNHGQDSLVKIEDYFTLTPEEATCIRWHMGAYETDAWDSYEQAILQFPNVLWTHTADMVASKIMGT